MVGLLPGRTLSGLVLPYGAPIAPAQITWNCVRSMPYCAPAPTTSLHQPRAPVASVATFALCDIDGITYTMGLVGSPNVRQLTVTSGNAPPRASGNSRAMRDTCVTPLAPSEPEGTAHGIVNVPNEADADARKDEDEEDGIDERAAAASVEQAGKGVRGDDGDNEEGTKRGSERSRATHLMLSWLVTNEAAWKGGISMTRHQDKMTTLMRHCISIFFWTKEINQ